MYSVFVRYPCMAINDIVQYMNTPTFFWLPKPLFLYGSIVLLSTLVLELYPRNYVGMLGYDCSLCMVINIVYSVTMGFSPTTLYC